MRPAHRCLQPPVRLQRQLRLRRRRFFAFFKVAEVVANRNADALQRLLADTRNLFELLRRHVGQRLLPS